MFCHLLPDCYVATQCLVVVTGLVCVMTHSMLNWRAPSGSVGVGEAPSSGVTSPKVLLCLLAYAPNWPEVHPHVLSTPTVALVHALCSHVCLEHTKHVRFMCFVCWMAGWLSSVLCPVYCTDNLTALFSSPDSRAAIAAPPLAVSQRGSTEGLPAPARCRFRSGIVPAS